MHVRVSRTAVAAKEAKTPGYKGDVEAIATGGDETHYLVPRDAHLEVVRKYAPPRVRHAIGRRRRFALGDAVESMLTGLGITKERVQWLTRKPCNCPARQRWLNQWGYARQEQIERIVRRAARWYGIG